MDIFAIFFLSCISILIGIIITLVVQYYILYVYFKKSPIARTPQKDNSLDYSLPEALKKQIDSNNLHSQPKDCSLPVSLILQFLFHELRHSESIKCWLYKKLSLEFDELLNKTTIGKFFESISIKDMHLGHQFPDIKSISVKDVKLDKREGHLESIDLCLNMDYTGNFSMCIDGRMKFGKTAFLSIKVKRVCGVVRLQFTRIPYTHWSFSFYTDPIIELAVESHFQGRQLQTNITNLIVNQIKKAIKRKHTLPNYKIRYKPFFIKTDPSQLDSDDTEIVPQGQLEVNCIEISRLSVPSGIENVYSTFTADSIPWICVYQRQDNVYMTLEITMTKVRQAQLGIIFKQEQSQVIVDSVSPHSSAFRSGLNPGDVVLAVENKIVNSVPQVAKLIKSTSGTNITLRVDRIAENYIMKMNGLIVEKIDTKTSINTDLADEELTQNEPDNFVIVDNGKLGDVTERKSRSLHTDRMKVLEKTSKPSTHIENAPSKFVQTIGNFSLRKRKTSVSDRSSNESSAKNTPTSSTPSTPQHSSFKQTISLPALLSAKKHSISEVPENTRGDCETVELEHASNSVDIHKSKLVIANALLSFNEEFKFCLKDGSKYLNINVWGTNSEGTDLLLGYANVPLSHILNECCNSVLGHYMRSYSFLPPTNVPPNNQTHPLLSHSGFEHVFCYGDVLLSFMWSHDDEVELKRKRMSLSSEIDEEMEDDTLTNKHDFIRTQFHRTTHCDFCSKKIWLKDAVQCRKCGLCCHKKCILKCQTSGGGCTPVDKNSLKSEVSDMIRPEITMTEVCEEMPDLEGKPTASLLKRVNSVNNLLTPGSQISQVQSKSLPPSPQRTPSRKQSLVAVNPFLMCPTVLDEIQTQPNEALDNINKLLEQVLLCPADEYLMDAAKESGQQLYNHLTYTEKTEKINVMMAELKKSLDCITSEHMELSKQMSAEESETGKTKLAFLMGQADAKVHGLSVLMLHYCSSLQHSQDKIV